jgi:iron complex outermembrane receptor protein
MTNNRQNRIATRSFLLSGAALVALSAMPAYAQAPAAPATDAETVVVTGTSIRGAAPVGSNVIAIGRTDIEATGAITMQELTSTIPAISGFGTSSKPSEGIVGIESQPTIHNLGQSSSLSTLILMNGRPMPVQGTLLAGDPSIIPGIAIQRVDVMPDGDSAIYGSSAVAGVINFITRKGYEGLETTATYGRAAQYNRSSLGLMAGHGWDTGSITFAYEYKSNSSLFQNAREFGKSADLRPLGGANFDTVNCTPASIATGSGSTANIYLYPYSGATIGTTTSLTAANANPCDASGNVEYFPSRTTHTFYVDVQQDIGKTSFDFTGGVYYRSSQNRGIPSAVTGTAFGPTGSSAALGTSSRNPFYVGNAATGTASEFIRWDPTELLGVNPTQKQGSFDAYEAVTVTREIAYGWSAEIDQIASAAFDLSHTDNGFCSTCALLALNGTVNSGATANNSISSTAVNDPFNLGNVTSVTRVLNTGNALDVWNPKATNRTPAAVLKELMSDQTSQQTKVWMNDVKVKFDGPILPLPAGDLKAAIGVEFNQVNDSQDSSGSNATGSSLVGGSNTNNFLPQSVRSAFIEFAIPVVSEDMGIPLVQRLDVQVAGRVDDYTTVGTTRNPKFGFTWNVIDGLKARGSFGTSFTAPNVTFVSGVGTVGGTTTSFTIPSTHINYPGSWCTTQVVCTTGANFPGLSIAGPNPNLKPQTGKTYSAGLDIDAGQLWKPLTGFSANITYWNTIFTNGIQLVSNIGAGYVTTPGLMQYLELAPPGGWTASSPIVQNYVAQNRITSALPATIYWIEHRIRVNGFNIDGEGIDGSFHYVYPSDDWGTFSWSYDVSSKFNWRLKGGPADSNNPWISYLNGRANTSVIYASAYEARMSAGWNYDPVNVTLFWNYTAPYWWQTSTGPFAACNPTTGLASCPNGYPSGFPITFYNGGFQRVKPNNTFDLDVSVKLPDNWLYGYSNGTRLSLNVRDLLGARPPFFNGGGGCSGATFCNAMDSFNGDSLQRVITFALRKTW